MRMKSAEIQSGILLGAVLMLSGFCVYALLVPRSVDTGAAAAGIGAEVSKRLNVSDSGAGRFVEEAHRTVTVRSLSLTRCEVLTSDGSGELRNDLSNLKRVDIEITALWDGWFHKRGRTVVGYSLIRDKGGAVRATPMKILSTTAFYTEDRW